MLESEYVIWQEEQGLSIVTLSPDLIGTKGLCGARLRCSEEPAKYSERVLQFLAGWRITGISSPGVTLTEQRHAG